ncbi:MAG: hypothetical protein QF918_04280 [Pirellulaceae bacterium]|jgi:hypothetical protein|nr:hypothetical protein [Pirellulaceae bacterium]MDP6558134.1 hypothetical protein [Pirellulaceae bacterium]
MPNRQGQYKWRKLLRPPPELPHVHCPASVETSRRVVEFGPEVSQIPLYIMAAMAPLSGRRGNRKFREIA